MESCLPRAQHAMNNAKVPVLTARWSYESNINHFFFTLTLMEHVGNCTNSCRSSVRETGSASAFRVAVSS
jgi:hypothetical protein